MITEQENQEQNQDTGTPETKVPDPKEMREKLASGGDDIIAIDDDGTDIPIETEPETSFEDQGLNEGEGQENIDPEKESEPDPESEPEPEPEKEPEQQEAVLATQPVWDNIKQRYEQEYGEGTFKMPEDLSQENEVDQLLSFLSQNLEPSLDNIPDIAKEIIQLHQEGKFDEEQYFSSRSPVKSDDVLKLPDKDFLFQYYKVKVGKSEKNPDGMDDESILAHVDKMSKIEMVEAASSKRKEIEKAREERQVREEAQRKEQFQKTLQQIETQRKKQAAEVVNRFKSRDKIFGIDVDPAEKAEFDKQFYDMVKIDPETGQTKIAQMLNDDNILYSVAYLLHKGDLSGYLSLIKEQTKKKVADKLDRKLEDSKGSTKIHKPVDPQKLV